MSDHLVQLPDRAGDGAVGPSVVIVEDDEAARELIVQYLAKLQLSNPIRLAEDGERAVELLGAEPGVPALVLLDVDLPGRSGLDVLEWIRKDGRLAAVPVVMLTGSSELADVDRAYDLGISSYLVKPVGYSAMQDVLTRLGAPWMLLAPAGGA